MDAWVNDIIIYAIYLIVVIALWHYAIPEKAKRPIRKAVGDFFRYLIYGIRPDGTKKQKKHRRDEIINERKEQVEDSKVEIFDWSKVGKHN
jgi:hypothetical protein